MSLMILRAVLAVVLLVLLLSPATSAFAQDAPFGDAVDGVILDGYYVQPGAEQVDVGELRGVLGSDEAALRPVVLAEEPPGGTAAFANDVLAEVGSGTVVVFTPDELQVASADYTDDEVEAALDFATREAGGSRNIPAFLRAFSDALGGRAQAQQGDGGFGGFGVLLVGGLLLVGLMTVVSGRRRRRQAAEQQRRALENARREVASQVSQMADSILALSDRVSLADDDDVNGLFQEATATYSAAQSLLERAAALSDLEQVSDRLDHARWQLEAVTARLDGREPPPPPAQEPACFFDPAHGAGVEQATLDTAAGQREVAVCAACAAALRNGQAPQPRMVDVGGRQVPAAMAPRSHGGGGLGLLGDIAVILGGHRTPYGWGGYGGYGGYGGWGMPAPRPFGMPRRRGGSVFAGGGLLGAPRRTSRGGGVRRSSGIRRGGGGRPRSGGMRRGGGGRRR